MSRGYPKFKAEIIDQSQIRDIDYNIVSGPKTVIMQTYTSDKGTEKWEYMSGFDGFTTVKGPINFNRHGQSQLTVAEILRNGGVVLGKRLVSEDATLANITIRARLFSVSSTDPTTNVTTEESYLYTYATSQKNMKNFKDTWKNVNKDFDPDKPFLKEYNDPTDPTKFTYEELQIDVPLFTITPMGRGATSLGFRINPEYLSGRKSSGYATYSVEVYENNATDYLEGIFFAMNPNIVVDDISQAMNPKVKINSRQIQAKFYDNAVSAIVNALAGKVSYTNPNDKVPMEVFLDYDTLINYDFLFGKSINGKVNLGHLHTCSESTGSSDWDNFIPDDIKDSVVDLSAAGGINLINGSYGTMTDRPMKNEEEYEKMLLDAWGANVDLKHPENNPLNYDPMIYDLDAYKVDAVFDCNWPLSVKLQIENVADYRGDFMFFMDFGTKLDDLSSILEYTYDIPYSRNVATYHNYFNIYDPYSRREITVTMPFLLAIKMVDHIETGVNKPFAGIANKMTFDNIIEDTINFLPYDVPGLDQKQMFADETINYLKYYDGVPVMDTMWTSNEEYSQLSFVSNVMGIQSIIKRLRSECPKIRYTFVDGDDLEKYLDDVKAILNEYASQYQVLDVQYMADEKYEINKIFYATLKVKFREWFQEEYFKIIAIN